MRRAYGLHMSAAFPAERGRRPIEDVDHVLCEQRAARERVERSSARERRAKLRRLHRAVLAFRDDIRTAMWEDLRKPPIETDLTEVWATLGEARYAIRHLGRWMAPHPVRSRLALAGTRSEVRYEPKGVVLVIAPWNFPFLLSLGPAVSAIAAGNSVVIKPSETTPSSAECVARIVRGAFDESEVAVVTGGPEVAQELVRRRFDHIFFTGSAGVGREVAKAAAENLVPVTLELGGKSPAIVDESADIPSAARKIAWGKWLNAGQTCIAPDYVLVHASKRDELVRELGAAVRTLFSAESRGRKDRTAMVDDRHLGRMRSLYEDAVRRGAGVAFGGGFEDERFVEPTLLTGVRPDMAIMREEIFGPLLPLLEFDRLDEAIDAVRSGDPPLALYVFGERRRDLARVLRKTASGTVVINDTNLQFIEPSLPFGGVGSSGFGRGHGFHGFVELSNARAVLRQRFRRPATQVLYPPYTQRRIVDWVVRWL